MFEKLRRMMEPAYPTFPLFDRLIFYFKCSCTHNQLFHFNKIQ